MNENHTEINLSITNESLKQLIEILEIDSIQDDSIKKYQSFSQSLKNHTPTEEELGQQKVWELMNTCYNALYDIDTIKDTLIKLYKIYFATERLKDKIKLDNNFVHSVKNIERLFMLHIHIGLDKSTLTGGEDNERE